MDGTRLAVAGGRHRRLLASRSRGLQLKLKFKFKF